jgi:hypothetical protein
MVDMKVLVYFNFSKINWKKMKSPSSMRNGKFHPPKCRSKVQKKGLLYTYSSKMPGPSPNFLIIPKKNFKTKNWKKKEVARGAARSLTDCWPQSASDGWLPAGPE